MTSYLNGKVIMMAPAMEMTVPPVVGQNIVPKWFGPPAPNGMGYVPLFALTADLWNTMHGPQDSASGPAQAGIRT
jgi:hypothetical protein